MTTFSALTTVLGKEGADRLGEAMERLIPEPTGVGVFEVEDGSGLWEVGGYFIDAPRHWWFGSAGCGFSAKPFVVSEIPETDWVAHVRRELAPVEAGRFFVYGSHDSDQVPEECEPLLIEAAMAFGTGHHGTTLGCLRALDRLANEGFVGKSVADIGCGTAVLAMGAARIWTGDVIASDIDEVAVDVARVNVSANKLEGRVRCVEAAGFDNPELSAAGPFDLIFANILKGPLIMLAPEMCANLERDGYLILSGLLNEQADEIIDVYARSGANLVHHEVIGEWSSLTLRKDG